MKNWNIGIDSYTISTTASASVGSTGDDVNEYTLSTGFDLSSTVTFIDSFPVPECPNPMSVKFNPDGTKMFVSFANRACQLGNQQDNCGLGADGFEYRYFIINTYNLSAPFNTSTASYAGDSERCILNEVADSVYDLEFSNDGKMLFVASRSSTDNDEEADNVHRYDLNSPFDHKLSHLASY